MTFKQFCAKGGKSKSPEKLAAIKKNLEKANAAKKSSSATDSNSVTSELVVK
jgi:hypothetical protein